MKKAINKIIAAILSIVTIFAFSSCMNRKPIDDKEKVTKTELLPGIEVNEQDAVQNADGKKVLHLSKLFSGTLKTSITLDEVKKVIEFSENLMKEYDVITLDSDSLTERIRKIANQMVKGEIQTVRIDINNLDSASVEDMNDYELSVCILVRNILLRICDPSIYMILREDSARAGATNNIFEWDNLYIVTKLDAVKDKGYTNFLDLSKSRYDIFGMPIIAVRSDEIWSSDNLLFPSNEFREINRQKLLAKGAENSEQ